MKSSSSPVKSSDLNGALEVSRSDLSLPSGLAGSPCLAGPEGDYQTAIRVLVAEDDPLINGSIASQLARLGYEVAARAYDGPQAVELATETRPSLVLMDLRMIDPESGREDPTAGLKATRAIQSRYPVAVVILTAHESPRLIAEATRAGACAYLVKPPGDNDLYRAIAIAFARFQDLLKQHQLATKLQCRNKQLEDALAKVRTLSGLLPICASCKQIRNDRGYWQQVDLYIAEHSEATFTHGICPDCGHKLYPELRGKVHLK